MQAQYLRVAAGAAAVTALSGAAGILLVIGPVTSRMPTPACGDSVVDCYLQADTIGAVIIGTVLLALTHVIVVATVVGLAAVLTGLLVVQRWPNRAVARMTAGVLVLIPPVGVTAATVAIAFLHFVAD